MDERRGEKFMAGCPLPVADAARLGQEASGSGQPLPDQAACDRAAVITLIAAEDARETAGVAGLRIRM